MLEARLVAVTAASAFVAVTRTRRLVPTSATPSGYVVPVAPAMSVNPEPESCCHWYAKARPGPVHVPCDALRVVPRSVAPVTVGTAAFTGGAALTVAVAALARLLVPSGFVAETSRRTLAPTSAPVSS